jgi:hypothetical protein
MRVPRHRLRHYQSEEPIRSSYGFFEACLLDAVVEPPIDSEQYSANGSGEDNEKERHGHDLVDVVQTDCGHQEVAETTLGCKHLAKQGSNQGQRKSNAEAGASAWLVERGLV